MRFAPLAIGALLGALSLAPPTWCLAQGATAGATPQRPPTVRCAPAATGPVLVFGRTGGNIRPTATVVDAAGRVSRAGLPDAPTVRPLARDSVVALARLAHDGGFWRIPAPGPRAPGRIADATRRYIIVRLSCGTRRREFTDDESPPAFRALQRRLEAAIAPR